MFDGRATGTNALHAMLLAAFVVAAAFVVGYVVFDLETVVLPSDPPPDASFRFGHDAATDTLVVTHYGGDNLDADRVVVVDQGFEPIGEFSVGATITAGESATLSDVDDDDAVYVLWVTEDGGYRTLASWNADQRTRASSDGIERDSHRNDAADQIAASAVVVPGAGGSRSVDTTEADAVPT